VHVVDQHHLRAVRAGALDARGIGRAPHHQPLPGRAESARRIADGHGVVARADGRHPRGPTARGEMHACNTESGAARLEAGRSAGTASQLEQRLRAPPRARISSPTPAPEARVVSPPDELDRSTAQPAANDRSRVGGVGAVRAHRRPSGQAIKPHWQSGFQDKSCDLACRWRMQRPVGWRGDYQAFPAWESGAAALARADHRLAESGALRLAALALLSRRGVAHGRWDSSRSGSLRPGARADADSRLQDVVNPLAVRYPCGPRCPQKAPNPRSHRAARARSGELGRYRRTLWRWRGDEIERAAGTQRCSSWSCSSTRAASSRAARFRDARSLSRGVGPRADGRQRGAPRHGRRLCGARSRHDRKVVMPRTANPARVEGSPRRTREVVLVTTSPGLPAREGDRVARGPHVVHPFRRAAHRAGHGDSRLELCTGAGAGCG